MCHRQLWDLGNGGCFHSGLRVWLICPSAALHSYCYVFLNHCKYRYSIYISICTVGTYSYVVTYAPYTPWRAGLLRDGSYYFDMKSWQEGLWEREREREKVFLYLRAFKSYAEVHPQWLTIRDHRFGTMCCIRIIFPYESWIWLAISIFFLEFHCGIQEAFQLSEFRCQCHRPHTIETTGTMELLADETVKLSFCTSLHTTYFCTRYNLLLYIYRCCT